MRDIEAVKVPQQGGNQEVGNGWMKQAEEVRKRRRRSTEGGQ